MYSSALVAAEWSIATMKADHAYLQALRKPKQESTSVSIPRPIGTKILVQRSVPLPSSVGGIILPEKAKDKPNEGTIVAVGNGRTANTGEVIPLDVSVGDKVIFQSHAGTEIEHGGASYLVMDEADLIAVTN